MSTHADKTQENQNRSVANIFSQNGSSESLSDFIDNRPEAVAQRKLQELANNSPQAMQMKAYQEMANNSPQTRYAAQLQSMATQHLSSKKLYIQQKKPMTSLYNKLTTDNNSSKVVQRTIGGGNKKLKGKNVKHDNGDEGTIVEALGTEPKDKYKVKWITGSNKGQETEEEPGKLSLVAPLENTKAATIESGKPGYMFHNETEATAILKEDGKPILRGKGKNGSWPNGLPKWIKDGKTKKGDTEWDKATADAELHALDSIDQQYYTLKHKPKGKLTLKMTATRPECKHCTKRIKQWCEFYGITRE